MNNYNEFLDQLINYRMINPIYSFLISLIDEQISDKEDKDNYLYIFLIYFSLLSDGNTCISLDKDILTSKWKKKVNGTKVLLESNTDFNEEEFNVFATQSYSLINDYLNIITETNLPTLIGTNKVFLIDNNYLYLMKYKLSKDSIKNSIERLFNYSNSDVASFDFENNCVKTIKGEVFTVKDRQKEASLVGVNKNIIITGGPGTGKTTSILFLLINILSSNINYDIKLTAPSGKAAVRMKESITNCLSFLTDEYKNNHQDIIKKVSDLSGDTVHKLLGTDFKTGGFEYNKDHQFNKNTIFIIDEASMIDINIFDSLLQAIPTGARVFIMGDKNQLPSVENGAVFADLLEFKKEYVIELDDSVRFGRDTKIYELADAVNNGTALPIKEEEFKEADLFKLEDVTKEKPIFYYQITDPKNEKKYISNILKIWGDKFVLSLKDDARNLDPNNLGYLDLLFNKTEVAKILCAENKGYRGVEFINSYMIKNYIDKTKITSVDNYYAGQLILVNKNNKLLDLNNGDAGILVTFKGDKTLYLMLKKTSEQVTNTAKINDQIFKLGNYIFYPFRMISLNDIDYGYGITIHKSQGSDYKNILVILPKTKGHPLINRQIVYTAITRTKGNTYILSSLDILNDAKDTKIERDTNIK